MTPTRKRILVVEDNPNISEMIRLGLQIEDYDIVCASEGKNALDLVHTQAFDLVILDVVVPGMDGYQICKEVKDNPATAYIPVLMLSGKSKTVDKVKGLNVGADDYLIKPFELVELSARIRALLRRSESFLDANPLTKLPGSNRIQQEIEKRIHSDIPFAVAYCDLSSFKSFNDVYGYQRGNQVILFTADVILNATQSHDGKSFVGHIGGDDFIFVCGEEVCERIAGQVIADFDSAIGSYYDQADLIRGGIETENRRGQIEKFGVMAIIIAAVFSSRRKFDSALEISETLTELKRFAKKSQSSIFVQEKRSG